MKPRIRKKDKDKHGNSRYILEFIKHGKFKTIALNPEKLVKLFYKRGFKDFTPTEEDQEYIDYYLEKGIDFYHWSDRCNWLRTKTVIEYFKKENLI